MMKPFSIARFVWNLSWATTGLFVSTPLAYAGYTPADPAVAPAQTAVAQDRPTPASPRRDTPKAFEQQLALNAADQKTQAQKQQDVLNAAAQRRQAQEQRQQQVIAEGKKKSEAQQKKQQDVLNAAAQKRQAQEQRQQQVIAEGKKKSQAQQQKQK